MTDAMDKLQAALRADIGAEVTFESATSRPWASISFRGERHRLALCVPGPVADSFLDGLLDREFDLPGHVLTDIVLAERRDDERGAHLVLDALTVEDDRA